MQAGRASAGLAMALLLASLAACGTPETVAGDSWRGPAAVPTGAEYTPPAALRRGIEGWALLRCIASAAHRPVDCAVLGEQPAGVGFGDAALRLAPNLTTEHRPGPGGKALSPGDAVLMPVAFCQPVENSRCAEVNQAMHAFAAHADQVTALLDAGHCREARTEAAAAAQPGLTRFVEERCAGK
jgi:hypothetical protein